MGPLTKLIASLILALLTMKGAGGLLAPPAGQATRRAVVAVDVPKAAVFTFDGLSPDQLTMVEWAVDLFDQAGLALPSIAFVAHSDPEQCQGRAGMTSYDGPATEVRLCGNKVGPTSRWVVLHELGHVWTTDAVGPLTRQAFLDVRGLDGWREGEWHERGAEHASEILVWGLMDRPVVPGHIDDNSCDELLAGYLVLVGEAPLHGFTDACEQSTGTSGDIAGTT
jgi:hypothetical protein